MQHGISKLSTMKQNCCSSDENQVDSTRNQGASQVSNMNQCEKATNKADDRESPTDETKVEEQKFTA